MDSSIIDIVHRRFGNGFQFINDFKAINDSRENEGRYKAIYPTELEFKKKNTDYSEGSFLQLGIKTGHQKFNIQLHFKRSISPFSTFRMPRRTSIILQKYSVLHFERLVLPVNVFITYMHYAYIYEICNIRLHI